MGRTGNNGIWRYEDVIVARFGPHVKLIAPCGESRRVTPETARKLAADLLQVANEAELLDKIPPANHTIIRKACDFTDEEMAALAEKQK